MYKKYYLFILLLLPYSFSFGWDADKINMQTYYHPMRTKEEFYSLYRQNMHRKTDNLNANIFWLEHALKAPFDHPVKALAKIESEVQWKEYQKLFLFQVYFLMMQDYILLAQQYEKPHILFFNPPFAKEINEGLQIAKIYYQRAQTYLQEAKKLADMAWEGRDDTPLSLDGEMDKWANMVYKLKNTDYYHEVNYERELKNRLQQVDTKIGQLKAITNP